MALPSVLEIKDQKLIRRFFKRFPEVTLVFDDKTQDIVLIFKSKLNKVFPIHTGLKQILKVNQAPNQTDQK